MGAGLVNALAGGGTLITFPVLTLLGLPAVSANVTNTVALCPGYLGATWAQRRLLAGQLRRLRVLAPACLVGGLAGGALLLASGEKLFRTLVPWLILLASLLLGAQEPIKRLLARRPASTAAPGGRGAPASREALAVLPVGAAAVYGGYFGAGVSVIILAALAIAYDEELTSLNALKQALSLAINVAAALFFLFSGKVAWVLALAMAVGALAGGFLGGRLATRIRPALLRALVVGIGLAVSAYYFVA